MKLFIYFSALLWIGLVSIFGAETDSNKSLADIEKKFNFPTGYLEQNFKMDGQTEALLQKINKAEAALNTESIEEFRDSSLEQPDTKQLPQLEKIENFSIEGPNGSIGLRLYTPKTSNPSILTLPTFIFLHGGGWVSGTLDEYDSMCQNICHQANCLVVSVDYGLAPEHPFPQPLEDCYAAVEWVESHIQEKGGDPKKIAIGGDSAGGNLAAVVTLKSRENQKPHFVCQVLICPMTNYNFETPSYFEFQDGYFLSRSAIKFCWDYYLNGFSGRSVLVSPLLAESLENLPPAVLVIANFDPLRDDGLIYGLRLHREGVPTLIKRFNTIHGFYIFEELDLSREAISFVSNQLRRLFSL